ncbi:MAG: nucleotide exchange factor GrpE [Gallionellaceae bacterium]|nr:nucleotide exchange factor GrpE [Gallionellaceae bacterium]
MSEQELNAAGAAEAGANEAAGKETMPSLEELLQQAELRAQEHHDAWLRAKAEAENTRRRAADEVDKARKFALERFSGDLLAVKDSLEAALATGDGVSIESLKSGVELTLKQLVSVFERHSIAEVNPLGQKFDPNTQQAIGMVDGDGEPNSVAQVLQKGYLLNDRVLRPAMVMVTKPRGD